LRGQPRIPNAKLDIRHRIPCSRLAREGVGDRDAPAVPRETTADAIYPEVVAMVKHKPTIYSGRCGEPHYI